MPGLLRVPEMEILGDEGANLDGAAGGALEVEGCVKRLPPLKAGCPPGDVGSDSEAGTILSPGWPGWPVVCGTAGGSGAGAGRGSD
jgi:hypothetical protein